MNKHDKPLDLAEATRLFAKFVQTVAAMRHPQTGCTWMLSQTHESLKRYMVEEAYEAIEAFDQKDDRKIADELGDVLLQVVLNAQIASEQHRFDVTDVIKAVDEKMIRRHPHVFAPQTTSARTHEEIEVQWDAIKAAEQAGSSKSVFADAAGKSFPATRQANEIGKVAAKIGFDWQSTREVFDKLVSEVEELRAELSASQNDAIADELGDLYFTLAQLCRHLGHDPEVIAHRGNQKFLRRFARLEKLAEDKKINVRSAESHVLEELWNHAKKTTF